MSKGTKERAAARRIVEQQKAREKRRAVTLWTSVAVVAVLIIAGLIGWGVLAGQEKDTASAAVPPTAVDDGTAFAIGDGPVKIDIYEDFMCPICHEFETAAAPTLQQMVTDKKVTVQYHPISILDRASNGTEYSTRSAAASAAAAQGGKFLEYHNVLFANQPAEGSDGLDNAKLIELGASVGLSGATFTDAVTSGTYEAWVAQATDKASAKGVTGTPTVMINGSKVTEANGGIPTPATLEAKVAAAAG